MAQLELNLPITFDATAALDISTSYISRLVSGTDGNISRLTQSVNNIYAGVENSGINLTSYEITLNADSVYIGNSTIFENGHIKTSYIDAGNVTATKLDSSDNGGGHIHIEDGTLEVYNPNDVPQIIIGIENDHAVMKFYKNGVCQYTLGPNSGNNEVTYSITGNFCKGYELVGSDGTKPSVTWTVKRGNTTVGTKTSSLCVPPTFISSNMIIKNDTYANSFYNNGGNTIIVNNTTGLISNYDDLYLTNPISVSSYSDYQFIILFYSTDTNMNYIFSNDYAYIVTYNTDNISDLTAYDESNSINPTVQNNLYWFGVDTDSTMAEYWSVNFFERSTDIYGFMIDTPGAVYTISCTYDNQTYSTTFTIPSVSRYISI